MVWMWVMRVVVRWVGLGGYGMVVGYEGSGEMGGIGWVWDGCGYEVWCTVVGAGKMQLINRVTWIG